MSSGSFLLLIPQFFGIFLLWNIVKIAVIIHYPTTIDAESVFVPTLACLPCATAHHRRWRSGCQYRSFRSMPTVTGSSSTANVSASPFWMLFSSVPPRLSSSDSTCRFLPITGVGTAITWLVSPSICTNALIELPSGIFTSVTTALPCFNSSCCSLVNLSNGHTSKQDRTSHPHFRLPFLPRQIGFCS